MNSVPLSMIGFHGEADVGHRLNYSFSKSTMQAFVDREKTLYANTHIVLILNSLTFQVQRSVVVSLGHREPRRNDTNGDVDTNHLKVVILSYLLPGP